MIEIRFDLHVRAFICFVLYFVKFGFHFIKKSNTSTHSKMRIGELKDKLHKHCGTPGFSQRLILKDGGQAIAHLDDDSKMLGYYSAESGMEIHIIDTDPFSMSRGGYVVSQLLPT
jgi:hypothetical protein